MMVLNLIFADVGRSRVLSLLNVLLAFAKAVSDYLKFQIWAMIHSRSREWVVHALRYVYIFNFWVCHFTYKSILTSCPLVKSVWCRYNWHVLMGRIVIVSTHSGTPKIIISCMECDVRKKTSRIGDMSVGPVMILTKNWKWTMFDKIRLHIRAQNIWLWESVRSGEKCGKRISRWWHM